MSTPRSSARTRSAASSCGADEVTTRLLVRLELDQAFLARFLEQVGERAKAVVALVEARVPALERLLDHRAPDLLLGPALGGQGLERGQHQVERLLLLVAVRLVAAARGRGFAALLGR